MASLNGDVTARITIKRKGCHWRHWCDNGDNGDPLAIHWRSIGDQWRQKIAIGSPLSPLNRHCHHWRHCRNMAILAMTSPFNGAIVAIKMEPMVTNGGRQW